MTEIDAHVLLDWLTHSHLPMRVFREEEGEWVVVDSSSEFVMGSGETAQLALSAAYHCPTSPEGAATGGGYSPYSD